MDSLRIPEFIEEHGEYEFSTSNHQFPHVYYRNKIAEYRGMLGIIKDAYEMGEIDLDTYTRLTTVQNYTHEHLWELRDEVKTFIPSHVGTNMYSLRLGGKNTNEYGISLKVEDGVWVKDGEYGTPPKVIPMPKAVNDGF